MGQFSDLLNAYIPNDHSRQVKSEYFVDSLLGKGNKIRKVMDLGCGLGKSRDYFMKKSSNIKWVGLDVEESPEAQQQIGNHQDIHTFDGIDMPFEDNYFDLIYCNQVFEHVRHPHKLLCEVYRVLGPNGFFVGSTSQLEPFHSLSMWNYTPYGFYLLLDEASLQLKEIRPGLDAFTLILRRALGSPGFFSWFWNIESPFNMIIALAGILMRKNPAWINLVKLLFCGQFSFLAYKPEITKHGVLK